MVLIFCYAGWTISRHFRKAKEGKCGGCAVQKECNRITCDDSAQ
ncbi:FeoB-associated Cys-rich membrane protein [Effusibacillus lacus]|nr:FeoB-associated Cys-rich membrane protein [Effusibacillus lacus]